LKRAIERHVVYPLASLLATEQVLLGDVISIDWDGKADCLQFLKEAEGALIAMGAPADHLAEAAAAHSDGRRLAFPTPAVATAEASGGARVVPAVAQRPLPTEEAKKKS
jgi:hypothetical protein